MKSRNWFFDYWMLAVFILVLLISAITSGFTSFWQLVFTICFGFLLWFALRLLELAIRRYIVHRVRGKQEGRSS